MNAPDLQQLAERAQAQRLDALRLAALLPDDSEHERAIGAARAAAVQLDGLRAELIRLIVNHTQDSQKLRKPMRMKSAILTKHFQKRQRTAERLLTRLSKAATARTVGSILFAPVPPRSRQAADDLRKAGLVTFLENLGTGEISIFLRQEAAPGPPQPKPTQEGFGNS